MIESTILNLYAKNPKIQICSKIETHDSILGMKHHFRLQEIIDELRNSYQRSQVFRLFKSSIAGMAMF